MTPNALKIETVEGYDGLLNAKTKEAMANVRKEGEIIEYWDGDVRRVARVVSMAVIYEDGQEAEAAALLSNELNLLADEGWIIGSLHDAVLFRMEHMGTLVDKMGVTHKFALGKRQWIMASLPFVKTSRRDPGGEVRLDNLTLPPLPLKTMHEPWDMIHSIISGTATNGETK